MANAELFENPGSTILMSETITPGAAITTCNRLESLNKRPNGKFSYVWALKIKYTQTATPGSTTDCHYEKMPLALASLYLKLGGISKPRINSLTGLDLVQISNKMLEVYPPHQIADYIPVADLAYGSGAQAYTCNIIFPLGTGWQADSNDKYTGIPSVAQLANGELKVGVISSSTIDTNWTIGDITLEIRALTVDLDEPLEPVAVFDEVVVKSESRALVPLSGANPIIHGLMAMDDTTSDFTQPTSFSLEVDDGPYLSGRDGDDQVTELNLMRKQDINEYQPTVCPVISPVGKDIRNCVAVRSRAVLDNVAGAHSGDYKILVRYSCDLSTENQVQILHSMGVDKDTAGVAVREVNALKTPARQGRALTTLKIGGRE